MDLIKVTLDEHISLLKELGYIVDGTSEEIPEYRRVSILKKDNIIGDIAYEEKNMFYLFRDNRIVGNRDLSKINFNKRKQKNIRGMIHLRLHDFNLKFNGYNQLVSDERNYICVTDNKTYMITKVVGEDGIEVKSLLEDVPDEEILDYIRRPSEKRLTYSLNEVTKK
ncbi:MAG: hypothetical protein J6O62_02570 [Bacilli bacterium]|nr:hypothetical protein [Bacilli bacterium]MBO6195548.1 hypothetical protein [Bacilli bacterium]